MHGQEKGFRESSIDNKYDTACDFHSKVRYGEESNHIHEEHDKHFQGGCSGVHL